MPRLTTLDLLGLVYSRLESNNRMYSRTEVLSAINSGYWIANLVAGWFQNTLPLRSGSTIANRHIYDVPEGIIFPQKCSFEGQALEKVSFSVLCNEWPVCLQDTTATVGKQVSRWSLVGINKFVLHPADAVGGAFVEITGIAQPDELVNDSDSIYIPKEGVTAVADYAAHIVQCKLQGTPFIQSLAFFKTFQSLLQLNKYWESYKQPNLYFDEAAPK